MAGLPEVCHLPMPDRADGPGQPCGGRGRRLGGWREAPFRTVFLSNRSISVRYRTDSGQTLWHGNQTRASLALETLGLGKLLGRSGC